LSPAGVSDLLVRGPWSHALVPANGARFHVAECGSEGDPMVVFLHGFPEFWWAWRHQLPVVAAAGWRAVAMDLRGYGASDKTPRGYDPFTAAADVSGVIRSLGETSAVLVGHGWGGFVAWSTAVLAARQVRALAAVSAPHPLALVRPSAHRLGTLRQVGLFQLPILPERHLLARDGAAVEQLLRAWSGPGAFPDAEASRRYRTALQIWPAPHCALEYHRWLVRSQLRSDGRRYAARMRAPIAVPVLQVDGAYDTATRPGTLPPHGLVTGPLQYDVLTTTGHFPHEESPDLFTTHLLNWLGTLSPG
jgi:pimeloyl-ACP methyl ester carboxylesterase